MLCGCWVLKGVTCIESTRALGCICHQHHGTVWTLAPLPVGLCPSAPDLHGDTAGMGRGEQVSPIFGVSVPSCVVFLCRTQCGCLEASLQRRERRAAGWLCSAVLSSIADAGSKFLMNSASHLLLVVLFLHFRVPGAPSKCNEGGASLVLWEAEMLRTLWTVLWARPCR